MKYLQLLILLSTTTFAFQPDTYITKRLPEDGLWLEKIRPMFFECASEPTILKKIKCKITRTPIKKNSPDSVLKQAKEKFGAKAVTIMTEDHIKIASLFYKRQDAPINILYATGYFEHFTPLKEWSAPFAALFPEFNIFSFDWRGYGQSDKSSFGSNAYKDIHAAIEYIRNDNDKPIVLVGFCMGSAIALHATLKAQEINKNIPDAIVLNSPFTEFINIMNRVSLDPDLNLIQWLAINSSILRTLKARQLDGNLLDLKPAELIRDINIPVYIEHSNADKMVPVSEAITVFNNAKTKKMFLKSELGSHVRLHTSVPYQYRNAFYKFLEHSNLLTKEKIEELFLKEKL